jgi:hypothetical protein
VDTTILESMCRASGMLDSALPDGLARLRTHFSQQANPTAELVAQQLQRLKEEAKHLFVHESPIDATGTPVGIPEPLWKSMAPSAKLAWAREHGYAPEPVQRRAKPLQLSAEQMAALAKLPAQARLDAYRELQAQAQQP